MEQGETVAKLSHPIKVTRERLSDIGVVWREFAKNRADFYRTKLSVAKSQWAKKPTA